MARTDPEQINAALHLYTSNSKENNTFTTFFNHFSSLLTEYSPHSSNVHKKDSQSLLNPTIESICESIRNELNQKSHQLKDELHSVVDFGDSQLAVHYIEKFVVKLASCLYKYEELDDIIVSTSLVCRCLVDLSKNPAFSPYILSMILQLLFSIHLNGDGRLCYISIVCSAAKRAVYIICELCVLNIKSETLGSQAPTMLHDIASQTFERVFICTLTHHIKWQKKSSVDFLLSKLYCFLAYLEVCLSSIERLFSKLFDNHEIQRELIVINSTQILKFIASNAINYNSNTLFDERDTRECLWRDLHLSRPDLSTLKDSLAWQQAACFCRLGLQASFLIIEILSEVSSINNSKQGALYADNTSRDISEKVAKKLALISSEGFELQYFTDYETFLSGKKGPNCKGKEKIDSLKGSELKTKQDMNIIEIFTQRLRHLLFDDQQPRSLIFTKPLFELALSCKLLSLSSPLSGAFFTKTLSKFRISSPISIPISLHLQKQYDNSCWYIYLGLLFIIGENSSVVKELVHISNKIVMLSLSAPISPAFSWCDPIWAGLSVTLTELYRVLQINITTEEPLTTCQFSHPNYTATIERLLISSIMRIEAAVSYLSYFDISNFAELPIIHFSNHFIRLLSEYFILFDYLRGVDAKQKAQLDNISSGAKLAKSAAKNLLAIFVNGIFAILYHRPKEFEEIFDLNTLSPSNKFNEIQLDTLAEVKGSLRCIFDDIEHLEGLHPFLGCYILTNVSCYWKIVPNHQLYPKAFSQLISFYRASLNRKALPINSIENVNSGHLFRSAFTGFDASVDHIILGLPTTLRIIFPVLTNYCSGFESGNCFQPGIVDRVGSNSNDKPQLHALSISDLAELSRFSASYSKNGHSLYLSETALSPSSGFSLEDLPRDLILYILSFLQLKSVKRIILRPPSKIFRDIFNTNAFWNSIYFSQFKDDYFYLRKASVTQLKPKKNSILINQSNNNSSANMICLHCKALESQFERIKSTNKIIKNACDPLCCDGIIKLHSWKLLYFQRMLSHRELRLAKNVTATSAICRVIGCYAACLSAKTLEIHMKKYHS